MSGSWAVARNLIREVLRMRPLMAFLAVALGGCTLGMAVWLHGAGGPADEKIQTFLSYSLRFSTTVLSLITIFISAATVARDIKRKEVFTIATKPISRERFLLGKFVGLAVLNLLLLAIVGGAVYGLSQVLRRTEPNTDAEHTRLNELVFVARKGVKPPLPDIGMQVRQRVEAIVEEKVRNETVYKNNPQLVRDMRMKLTAEIGKQLLIQSSAIAPSGYKIWKFSGIQPQNREQGYMFIRYKQEVSVNPRDLALTNEWLIGPEDPVIAGGRSFARKDAIRTFHEFAVPVTDLSATGDLYVAYRNSPRNGPITVIFPADVGIEVLYVAGGFEGNFLRCLALIYLRLLFLAVLGLALGAWLSFPVAVLVVLVVFVLGLSSDFLAGAMKWEATRVLAAITKAMIAPLPKFAAYDPLPQFEKGRMVSYDMLAKCGLYMIVLKAGIVGFFGYLVFKFRELARVIV